MRLGVKITAVRPLLFKQPKKYYGHYPSSCADFRPFYGCEARRTAFYEFTLWFMEIGELFVVRRLLLNTHYLCQQKSGIITQHICIFFCNFKLVRKIPINAIVQFPRSVRAIPDPLDLTIRDERLATKSSTRGTSPQLIQLRPFSP